MTKLDQLDQIENLLHTLITILQQKLQSNDSHEIVTQKNYLKSYRFLLIR